MRNVPALLNVGVMMKGLLFLTVYFMVYCCKDCKAGHWPLRPLNLVSCLEPITSRETQTEAATMVIQRLLPPEKAALFQVKVSKAYNKTAFGLLYTKEFDNVTRVFIRASIYQK